MTTIILNVLYIYIYNLHLYLNHIDPANDNTHEDKKDDFTQQPLKSELRKEFKACFS